MDSFLYFETSNQPAFRACIREKLNQLKFPPNDLTEPSSIYFPLVFLSHPTRQVRRQCFIEHAMVTENPGLRIPTSLTTTSIDGEGPPWRNNAVGSLDKEIIRRVIRSRIGEVASCYDRGLTGRPTMQGRVAIQFTIMGDGSVQTVRLHNTTMENAFVEDCVLRSACDLRFPATNGGGFVRVSYPYNFTTNLAD